MPDVFDQLAAQTKPAPTPGATVSQGPQQPDIFDHLAAQQNPAQAGAGADQHGSVYNAANSLLNRDTTYQNNTGHPLVDKALNFVDNLANPVSWLQGTAKGALSTATGVGSVVNKLTGSKQPFNQDNLKDLTVAQGPGQSVGKAAEQMLEFAGGEGAAAKTFGTAGKIGASGILSAVQSGGDPVATTLGTILPAVMSQPVVKTAGKMIGKYLDLKSGAGEGAIARAFLNPDSNGLSRVLKGSLDVDNIVTNLGEATTKYRNQAAAEYTQRLDKIANTQVQGWPTKSSAFMADIDYTLTNELKKFGVKQEANGAWNFNHLTGADPNDIKELISTVYNWGTRGDVRDMTPAGLDVLKKKLGEFADKGGAMSALGSRMYERAKLGLNDIIPGYSQMTSEYNKAQELLRQFKSEFSVSPSGGSNQGTISRKIQTLFKQNTDYKELLMNKIPNGSDILDQIAGLHLKSVMPKGMLKILLGGYGLHGMTAVLSSPRLVGEGARIAGRAAQSPATPVIANGARRAIQAGVNNAQPTGMLSNSQ